MRPRLLPRTASPLALPPWDKSASTLIRRSAFCFQWLVVSLVLRKNGKHQQYECGYCGSGLRPFPYEIEEPFGVDEQGRTIIETFLWLDPRAGKAGRHDKAAGLPAFNLGTKPLAAERGY